MSEMLDELVHELNGFVLQGVVGHGRVGCC